MKKFIAVLFMLTATASLFAQSGRIRVYFAGFECYRETWDDILNSDGKGDEVFFNFSFLLADKNDNSKLSYEKRTMVYGDATGPFSNRISAGTCVDAFGNRKGGIKGGDTYRCNDLIGEYDMADGDILSVTPTGWEHDPISDNSISFMTTFKSYSNTINQKLGPIMKVLNVATLNVGAVIMQTTALGLAKVNAGGDQGELGKPGTRPIGMEKSGAFEAKLVALNTPNLPTICNSDMGFGRGVIAVNYDETAVHNLRDHGNYTILIRVEYTPAPAATNNTPSAANSGPNKTFKQVGTPNTSPIAGAWTGTYGTGQNNTPSYYSFKLNADGTMQVIDANNSVIAGGTYSFSNNQLNGKYTYSNGGPFSFAATLSGSQLNGTWGTGTNVSGGGKWVMNKSAVSATGNIR
ncbi:MAG: hypothetical protein RIS73_1875 [Bacteroidota bacterium]